MNLPPEFITGAFATNDERGTFYKKGVISLRLRVINLRLKGLRATNVVIGEDLTTPALLVGDEAWPASAVSDELIRFDVDEARVFVNRSLTNVSVGLGSDELTLTRASTDWTFTVTVSTGDDQGRVLGALDLRRLVPDEREALRRRTVAAADDLLPPTAVEVITAAFNDLATVERPREVGA